MEILLAIVVASAVILFGVLISMGNDRQRRAIENLREQVVLWAIQDLQIKREHLAYNIQIPDPLGWLNRVVSNVCGCDLKLQILESFDEPRTIVCISKDSATKIVFSPISPSELRSLSRGKSSRLAKLADHNPLFSLPRGVSFYEISALNSGIFFDLEVSLFWKKITGREERRIEKLWMYMI